MSVVFFSFFFKKREFLLFIEPFGDAPMSPELCRLMETLRRGSSRWLSFTPDRIQATYTLPPGANRATLVALVAPVWPKRGRGTKSKWLLHCSFFWHDLGRFVDMILRFSRFALLLREEG